MSTSMAPDECELPGSVDEAPPPFEPAADTAVATTLAFNLLGASRRVRSAFPTVTLELAMVGVLVDDMARAAEFYRRLGVAVPEDVDDKDHFEIAMSGLTFFLNTKRSNKRWDPAQTSASGGYRIVLEFFLETPGALDAKYEELTAYGYVGHWEPYDVTRELRFAMVDDPDGNTILLSATRPAD